MNRSTLKKLLIRTGIIIFSAIVVLISMNAVTNYEIEASRQKYLQTTLGQVLPAAKYNQVNLSNYTSQFQTLQNMYAAYDNEGTLSGYIIDIKGQVEDRPIITRMAFSKDGTTLGSVEILGEDQTPSQLVTSIFDQTFFDQFKEVRVPMALLADMSVSNEVTEQYPPVEGLTDGVFRAAATKADSSTYTDYVEITIKQGRIVKVVWDGTAGDGGKNKAKASIDGEYTLNNKVLWAEQAYAMQNKLIEVQDPDRIAMKSDGTTGVVANVSINVNAFVTLSKQCLDASLKGQPSSPLPTTVPSDEDASSTTPSANATQPKSNSTTEQSDENSSGFSGGEDGVVQKDENNVLSASIDSLAVSEIKTKINANVDQAAAARAIVSSVNQAYIFLMEYLKGGT